MTAWTNPTADLIPNFCLIFWTKKSHDLPESHKTITVSTVIFTSHIHIAETFLLSKQAIHLETVQKLP